MEINAEKTKIMSNIQEKIIDNGIKVNGTTLDHINQYTYLGALVIDRMAKTKISLTKLKVIWDNKSISLASKIRLLRSMFISIFLYACETWRNVETMLLNGRASASMRLQ